MTFLNPLVLLGLAAAAIPLIIHLFNFRRPKQVDFSSLAFLKELQKSTMQRVRIKQWLLLLLRTLALACLILAFARPTLTSDLGAALGGRAHTSVALVVDNSLSMTLRDAQGGYLDQAQTLAAGLIDQMEMGDEIFVLPTASDAVTDPAPYTTRGPALDAIQDIEPQTGTVPMARAVARAGALLADASHLNRELYLITDRQRSTWSDSLLTDVPEDVRVVLIPVGERSYPNVAVTGVRTLSRIIEAGQPVRFAATLVNHGEERLAGYVASVYLEGERVAQATADLEPNVETEVTFTATPQQRGWLAGVVEIEDDAFAYDNQRFFAFNVPERRRVLLVRGEGQQTNYLELVLSSQLTRGRVVFEVETIAEAALAATALGGFDAVVLVGPRSLSSGENAALARYVADGGGLLFFPQLGAQSDDYNALFRNLGGGEFSGFSGTPGPGQPVATFDRVDLEHPLFEGIFDTARRRGRPSLEQADVYQAMNYTARSGGEQTLIRLSNRFPFLQEIRHGDGVALMLAVAPEPQWSDLPVRGLFVPLLYRSIYYLSSGDAASGESLVVGQPGEVRLSGVSDTAPLRLTGPDGAEYTPEQRTLFGAVLLQTDGSLRTPGLYDLRSGDQLVRRLAVNLDPAESDLTPLAPDDAQDALATALDHDVRLLQIGDTGADGVLAALSAERTGLELWNLFLLLALGFLIAEMLVARHWQPEG